MRIQLNTRLVDCPTWWRNFIHFLDDTIEPPGGIVWCSQNIMLIKQQANQCLNAQFSVDTNTPGLATVSVIFSSEDEYIFFKLKYS